MISMGMRYNSFFDWINRINIKLPIFYLNPFFCFLYPIYFLTIFHWRNIWIVISVVVIIFLPLASYYLVKNLNPDRRCSTEFLAMEDLPLLFCFLTENGYDIDTKLTKLMVQGKSAATKRNLVCYIRQT